MTGKTTANNVWEKLALANRVLARYGVALSTIADAPEGRVRWRLCVVANQAGATTIISPAIDTGEMGRTLDIICALIEHIERTDKTNS